MRHVKISVMLLVLAFIILSGCGDQQSTAIFDPETGTHSADWPQFHGRTLLDNTAICQECHGTDLRGGISSVSCFTPSFNGMACHRHDAGWNNPDLHGADAKELTGPMKGFQYCSRCHGADFDGGLLSAGCYSASCHGQGIPHSPAPWDGTGGSRTHQDTRVQNADVCATCHAGQSASPAPPGTPYNCFNNTLCHSTSTGHSNAVSWETDHSLTARSDNTTCATSSCHGTDYTGGASGVSCYECHLGGPAPSPYMMHPNLWSNPRGSHDNYLGNIGKNASSCSPSYPGIAQYCHGDGLPNDAGQLTDPPNGSWSGAPTCYKCHKKEWNAP